MASLREGKQHREGITIWVNMVDQRQGKARAGD
jgi:hypothetical protein